MKRVFSILIYILLPFFTLVAQDGINVKSFKELSNDLDARVNYPKIDQNGKTCALVKVVTTEGDFTFDNGQLGVVAAIHKPELSEWWVYLPEKTMKLKIMHPVYGQLNTDSGDGFYYFPNSLMGATTYRLELTTQRKIVSYEPTKIKTGFLIIKSDPDTCQVFLTENGIEQYAGNTPFQKKLPYGTYTYRIKRSLYHDEVGIAVVDNTRVDQKIMLRPAFGSLKVTTNPPGATVTFDGDRASYVTPCEIPYLASGEHFLNIMSPRYSSHREKVVIQDGQVSTLNVSLEPRFAQVSINTLAQAAILINEEQRGIGSFVGDLGEGIYDVEVTLAQHRRATRQIEVVAKQPQSLTLNPTPIYGTLDVISNPLDAQVTINGISYGTTPTTIENLLIGEYDVVVSKEGCATETRKVTITENNLSTIEVELPQGKPLTILSDASGDDVYIDGLKQGVTPLKTTLSFGSHQIELRRRDKKVGKQIMVTPTGGDNIIKMGFGLQPQWSTSITPKQKQVLEKLIGNMIEVEGGTFTMGATPEQGNDAFTDEKPAHQVTLSDYYICKYEVTQEEWEVVMGNNPSYFKGSNRPVEEVSWYDCQEFIRKLNLLTGLTFSLPTEAEWEYAARGGSKSQGYKYSGSNNIDDVAWYTRNSSSKTHKVGTKSPNELGIYDMSGNVWEWCSDWYGSYSSLSQANPTGPSSGSNRVYRGGGWSDYARRCRVSYRDGGNPDYRNSLLGFRLVMP